MDRADLDCNGFTHERKREQNKQTLERRPWQHFLHCNLKRKMVEEVLVKLKIAAIEKFAFSFFLF
jgi:hypothetical protein